MTLYFGAIITLTATLFYSLRYSFVKDLGRYSLSKAQTNFFYRLFSLIPIILLVILTGENIFGFQSDFIVWLFIALGISVAFGLLQIFILQKQDFSLFGTLKSFSILFSTLGGLIILHETYSFKQYIGLFVIGISFLFLLIPQREKLKELLTSSGWIILYYLVEAAVYIVNKKAVGLSSPAIFTFYMTLGLIVSNLLIAFFLREKLYRVDNRKANVLLLLVGLFSALSFIGISYGYKYLPVGIVVAISSLEAFISLWLARKKYKEENLLPKILASIVAFAGVLLIVL